MTEALHFAGHGSCTFPGRYEFTFLSTCLVSWTSVWLSHSQSSNIISAPVISFPKLRCQCLSENMDIALTCHRCLPRPPPPFSLGLQWWKKRYFCEYHIPCSIRNSTSFASPRCSYRSNSLGVNSVSVFSGLLLWCVFSLWSEASSHCALLACCSVAPKAPSNGSVQLRSESYSRPNFVCGGVKGLGLQASG